MQTNKWSEKQHEKDTIRIETFSDGVFCIAVTLLSIEISVELKEHENKSGPAPCAIEKMANLCGVCYRLYKCLTCVDRYFKISVTQTTP